MAKRHRTGLNYVSGCILERLAIASCHTAQQQYSICNNMHISHTLKQHLLVRKVVVTKRPEHENEFFLCFSCVFSCVQLSGLDFPGSQLFNFHHASDILWLLHFPHFKHDTLVLASGEFVDWYPVAAVPSSASPRMHPAHPKQPALKKMVNFGDLMWLVNVQKASVVSLSSFKSTYVNIHAKWLLGTKVHWRVMKCTSDAALTWMPNNSPQRKPPAVKALWWFVYDPSYNAFEPLLLCIRLPYHSCISIPLVHLKIQLL